jgi:hypothetical protein
VIRRPDLQALLALLQQQPRHDPHDDLVRRVVRLRARDVCEYCLRRSADPFHLDHIIPPALWPRYVAGRLAGVAAVTGRRGPDHLDNFAWCCPLCNESKRQRVSARVERRAQRLFDPRYDVWPDHFVFMRNYLIIAGITPVGLATERVLKFNGGGIDGPLATRYDDIVTNRYPPDWARPWLV